MQSIPRTLKPISRTGLASAILGLLALFAVTLSPVRAADVPDDDDQDIMIRSTLMTFNDANVTGNYSVLIARASSQFQAQVTPEKLAAAFEGFRKNKLYIDDVVTADYDSYEKAKVDGDGVLTLAGVFKTDELTVKYNLRYVKNDSDWKLLGINVDVNKKKAEASK
jgi:hypothetical protein